MTARHKLTDKLADTAVMAMHAGVDVELPDGEAYALLPQLVKPRAACRSSRSTRPWRAC
jgi:beta-glucosidase